MNNNSIAAKSNTRTRIVIALAASLTALWQLPDPASQDSGLTKPMERLTPKQDELNIIAQPSPTEIKTPRPIAL